MKTLLRIQELPRLQDWKPGTKVKSGSLTLTLGKPTWVSKDNKLHPAYFATDTPSRPETIYLESDLTEG